MDLRILLAPLLGALIGYATNWIAIRMLFKPAKPVYIRGHRVPLTPGLIPKEKSRLAVSIGNAVGAELLSEESVRTALLSPAMLAKIEAGVDELIARGAADDRTLLECLVSVIGQERAEAGFADGKARLAAYLSEKLIEADLGAAVSRGASESIKRKTPSGIGDFISNVVDDRLKQNVSSQIQGAVNGYIARHADQVVRSAVDSEADKLAHTTLRALVEQNANSLPTVKTKLLDAYRFVIERSLTTALRAIDLSGIVRARIESIDDGDIERMVLSVADHELNAIVYLGALLGFLMGFINLLF